MGVSHTRPTENLGRSNVRWVGLIQAGRIAIQLASVVTLTKLLAPSDYGLMAMATSIIGLAYIIRDMGASAALVQAKLLSPELLSTAFSLNLAWSFALAAATVLSSHFVALGFREPRLQWVLIALAVSLPLSALGAVHQALMERQSRFRDVARIEISASLLAFGIALSAAWYGLGVYSLVMQVLTVAAVSTASFWLLSSWRPSIDWKHAEFRKIWHFSANLTGFNIAMFFERNADNMLIGRFLGASALGWYSLAYNIMLLPLQHLTYVLNRALFPIFARQDREKMRESYLKMISMLALISAPAVCGLWAIRVPLVRVVLGDKWLPVSEILTWLAPTALLQCFTATLGPVLMAIGRTDIMRNFSLIFVPLSLAAFVCGLPFGVAGVAAAYFLITTLTLLPAFYFTLREIDLGLGDLAVGVWRPVVIGLAMAALIALTDKWVMPPDAQALLRLAILVPAGAGFYLISVVLLAPDLLIEIKEHLWHRS